MRFSLWLEGLSGGALGVVRIISATCALCSGFLCSHDGSACEDANVAEAVRRQLANNVSAVWLSHDGEILITREGTATSAYRTVQLSRLWTRDDISEFAVCGGGRAVGLRGDSRTLVIIELETGATLSSRELPTQDPERGRPFWDLKHRVHGFQRLSFAYRSATVAALSEGAPAIILFFSLTTKRLQYVDTDRMGCDRLVLSPDGRHAVFMDWEDGLAKMSMISAPRPEFSLTLEVPVAVGVSGFAYTADGRACVIRAVAVPESNEQRIAVEIFDSGFQRDPDTLVGPSYTPTGNPDEKVVVAAQCVRTLGGELLIVALNSGRVQCFDVARNAFVQTLALPFERIAAFDVRASREQNRLVLAAVSADGRVSIGTARVDSSCALASTPAVRDAASRPRFVNRLDGRKRPKEGAVWRRPWQR